VIDGAGDTAGAAAAVVLAAVLVWAAVAKLRSPIRTAEDFASLGLRRPWLLARLVPGVEVVVATMLLVVRPWGGTAATALLVGFTTIIVRVLLDPEAFVGASCACFGGSSHRPLAWPAVARNGVLLALALTAAIA